MRRSLSPYATRIPALLVLLIAAVSYQPGETFGQNPDGRLRHTVAGNRETWRIDEPNVRKKIIEFQEIRFQPGDQVTVRAGGCVQTGGVGKTWKRYLDPLGPNSDRLYHGMVLIPGAIGTLPADKLGNFARILIVQGHPFTVQRITEPRKAHLWLGYEDDDYDDNGYWGQDAGTQGQCRLGNGWVEHAFVVVTIDHQPASPQAPLPFDLVLNDVDDNLMLLNPKWGAQVTPPNFAPPDANQCGGAPASNRCTSQPTTFDNGSICDLAGYDGHHNWAAGTYEGTIYWNGKSPEGEDDDYNIRLVPPDRAGVTSASGLASTGEQTLKLEFSSDETIDHFTTPWWDKFHKAVDDSDAAAQQLIFQRRAIVTGLVGLDCAHSCSPEVHPVWAIAMRVSDSSADEEWAIFVRRSGDEGFCSDDEHYLDDLEGDKFTFRLPWRPGATGVTVSQATTFRCRFGQATGPEVISTPNQGVLVSFWLPLTQSGYERTHGELHLQWTAGAGITAGSPAAPTRSLASSGSVRRRVVDSRGGPEDRFRQLLARMTPEQRKVYDAQLTRKPITPDSQQLRPAAPPRHIDSLPARLATRTRRPHDRAVPDPLKKAEDQKKIDALHALFGDQLPGFSDSRRTSPPRRRSP